MKNEFIEYLVAKNDQELVDTFNNDVGNPGWVAARGRFHIALREEFAKRHFIFPESWKPGIISTKHKIYLDGLQIKEIKEIK